MAAILAPITTISSLTTRAGGLSPAVFWEASQEEAHDPELDAEPSRSAELDLGIAERGVWGEVGLPGPHQIGVVGAEGDHLVDRELGKRVPGVLRTTLGRQHSQRVEGAAAGDVAGVVERA